MTTEYEENYEIRNPEIELKLKEIGELLKTACNTIPGYGFALMIFGFGANHDLFYISNAERDTIIDTMKEFIAKNEKPQNV